MKGTKITVIDDNVHIDCPHCDNWEQIGADEQRHHLNTFTNVKWNVKKTVSITHCTECNNRFLLEWDYKNTQICPEVENTTYTLSELGQILDSYQVECQLKYNTGTVPDAREWFSKKFNIKIPT